MIVDFEFTIVTRKDLLLVSGAISNSLDKYQVMKLEGPPIILTEDGKLRLFQKRNLEKLMYSISRIFRSKPELFIPFNGQIQLSMNHQGESTLSTVYLTKYLHGDGRKPRYLATSRVTLNVISSTACLHYL